MEQQVKGFFERIGGRKFVMALIVMAIGAGVDAAGKNGLSTNLAALLAAIFTAFSTANALITAKTEQIKPLTEAAPAPQLDPGQVADAVVSRIAGPLGNDISSLQQQQAKQILLAETTQASMGSILNGIKALLTNSVR